MDTLLAWRRVMQQLRAALANWTAACGWCSEWIASSRRHAYQLAACLRLQLQSLPSLQACSKGTIVSKRMKDQHAVSSFSACHPSWLACGCGQLMRGSADVP